MAVQVFFLGYHSGLHGHARECRRPTVPRLRAVARSCQNDVRGHDGNFLFGSQCGEARSFFCARATFEPEFGNFSAVAAARNRRQLCGHPARTTNTFHDFLPRLIRTGSRGFDRIDMAGYNAAGRQAVNCPQIQRSIPSPDDLVRRAESLIPFLRKRAGDADRSGEFSPEAIRQLREAGFFRILQPARFGGYGLDPATLWSVTRQLGRGCGCTAFIISQLAVHSWIVGMFEASAQAEVFKDAGDAIVSNLSVGVRRQMKGSMTDGGHVVSGVWDFASGIDFADWVIAAVRVPNADGIMEERIALVPRQEFAVEQDSWTMVGTRATGSKRVTLSDTFIPLYRTVAWADVESGAYPVFRSMTGRSIREHAQEVSLYFHLPRPLLRSLAR